MMSAQRKFNQIIWWMKITFGLFFIISGVDKFANWIMIWEQHYGSFIIRTIPINITLFLKGVGLLEIVLGLLFFTKWVREAAYFSFAWILLWTLNSCCGSYFNIGFYSVVIALTVASLGRLCEIKDEMNW